MEHKLIDNLDRKQYEFHVEGKVARLEYIKTNGRIFLTHTEVPKEFAGKGLGSALIKAVLAEIERNDWTLIPLCPFVALYLNRHPDMKKLVLKGVNIK